MIYGLLILFNVLEFFLMDDRKKHKLCFRMEKIFVTECIFWQETKPFVCDVMLHIRSYILVWQVLHHSSDTFGAL